MNHKFELIRNESVSPEVHQRHEKTVKRELEERMHRYAELSIEVSPRMREYMGHLQAEYES